MHRTSLRAIVSLSATASLFAIGCGGKSSGKHDAGSGATADLSVGAAAHDLATSAPTPDLAVAVAPARCNGSVASTAKPGMTPVATPGLTLPSGFKIETIAKVGSARELAALPNGDLLVGTSGTSVYLVPAAEADAAAGAPVVFTTIADGPTQGVTFVQSSCTVYVSTQHGVYSLPYLDGQLPAAAATQIGSVRSGMVTPNSDGDVHTSTSVAFAGGKLYVGVGSGCNACVEVDPTRATIQQLDPDGKNMTTRATRMRNAIALATNPATGTLWAGGAGQDDLVDGHPYEYFDAVTLHSGMADYGWPACEENHNAYGSGANCAPTVQPILEMPPYSTIIGAVFYPTTQTGAHAFSTTNRGLFLTAHGSWHKTNNVYHTPPRVAFVSMNGDAPAIAVDWTDASKQWTEFVGGFQLADQLTRIARPTGIAVGAQGSLFIADDQNGVVYRIRPL
jgi:glucose/arabinose dehydrogenase